MASRVAALVRELIEQSLPVFLAAAEKQSALVIQTDVKEFAAENIQAQFRAIEESASVFSAFTALKNLYAEDSILQSRSKTYNSHGEAEYWSLSRFLLSGPGRVAVQMSRGLSQTSAVEEVVNAYSQLVIGSNLPIDLYAHIPDLRLSSGAIQLDESVALRMSTPAESEHLLTRPSLYRRAFGATPSPVLTISGHDRKMRDFADVYPALDSSHIERLQACVAYVQLALDSKLRADDFAILNALWFPTWTGHLDVLSAVDPQYPARSWRDRTPVDKVEDSRWDVLKSSWPEYKTATRQERYRRAAARFSTSLHRLSSEDAILDQCIALETLLRPSPGAVSEHVASRYAMVVGRSDTERRTQYEQVKAFYNVRSGITHGDKLDERIKNFCKRLSPELQEHLPTTVEGVSFIGQRLVARALLRFLSYPTLHEDLDELPFAAGVKELGMLKRGAVIVPVDKGKPAGR